MPRDLRQVWRRTITTESIRSRIMPRFNSWHLCQSTSELSVQYSYVEKLILDRKFIIYFPMNDDRLVKLNSGLR